MRIVYLDFETRSTVDIKKSGAWHYAESPNTDILCLCYAYGEEEVQTLIGPHDFSFRDKPMVIGTPADLLLELAGEQDVIFEAHNAFFEQSIWHNIMHKRYGWPDIPVHRWRCSAAKCAAHALPRKLGEAGKALKLPVQKDDAGHRVMLQLSKPRRPSKENPDKFWEPDKVPEKFEQLYSYCRTDVEAERAISHALRDLSDTEKQVWELDQKINARGVMVDMKAVNSALDIAAQFNERAIKQITQLTKGEVTSLTQRQRTLDWITNQGVDMPDMTKATVSETLKQDLPPLVREVLILRQRVGKTSTAKYKALKDAVCKDGRLRDLFMYHGASTGRWSGKLVQLQNIPRGSIKDTAACIEVIKERDLDWLETLYDDPMEALSSCLRGMFVATSGLHLIAADYSAIEARVLVWLARDDKAVKRFAEGVDTYVDMACMIYGAVPGEVDRDMRQMGKQVVLGCGYQMGWSRFMDTCASYGMDVDEELAQQAVEAYRLKYKKVVEFWYGIERAAVAAVREPGKAFVFNRIKYIVKGNRLYCKLPSGRLLSYNYPRLRAITTPWDEEKQQLHFMGVNSVTKKWEEHYTYGGSLVENITQAVARDIMAEAMLRVEDAGFKILMSVHDELVTEVRHVHCGASYIEPAQGNKYVKRLEEQMCIIPDWGQDDVVGNIPISAEGWYGQRYKK